MTLGYIEKNFLPEEKDLEKINTFTRSKFGADELYTFNAVLCNNDIDRDYEKFSLEALEQLKEKFVGKTGISDHSMRASDQKARIFDTWIEKVPGRKTADGEDYYQLKAKAYMVKSEENASLITEIEAGIKKEISVSCSVQKSVCSVCGCNKRTKRCEHMAGQLYNGERAYSVLSDVSDAYEFSFVAVPAQREAGVTKSFDIKRKGDSMTDILKTLKSCEGSVTVSKQQADKIVSHIDALDEDAQLGREYKKSLTAEVVSLCAKTMPEMDLSVFSSVAGVMTTKELCSFKNAFLRMKSHESAAPQLKSKSKDTSNIAHSNYKI